MDQSQQDKLERRRKALYLAVKNHSPQLYERAIQIGHLALPEFAGPDPIKRAAAVENATLSLIAEIVGIDVTA